MPQPCRARTLLLGMMAIVALLLVNPDSAEAATFFVEDSSAVGDENPGDGICRSKFRPGTLLRPCTLMAAVQEANALSGTHTIIVPAGTFFFDNLGVTGQMSIIGAGAAATSLTASGLFNNSILVQNNFPDGNGTGPAARLELHNLTYRDSNALVNLGGALLIENSVVSGIQAASGAVDHRPLFPVNIVDNPFQPTSITTIRNSRITNNVAPLISNSLAGGGLTIGGGEVVIESSTIDGNEGRCDTCAGAIVIHRRFEGANTAPRVTLQNVTISGNQAPANAAGGIILERGRLTLRNTTIANNSQQGIAMVNLPNPADIPSFTATNTLFANNGGAGSFNCSATAMTHFAPGSTNNLDSGSTCGFATQPGGISNVNALLGPLQSNGGPTQTHALLDNSPAIDTGTCTLLTDQRGNSRPRDGDGNGVAQCDIGAVEAPSRRPGANLGVPSLNPGSASVRVNETLTETFVWDVPAPQNWGALGTLDFRLRANGSIVFWVRWDQLLDTFQLVDAAGRPTGFPVPPGVDLPLSANGVTLNVAATRSQGSGITGQRATLVLPLRFDESTSGKVFSIEVSAQDDEGRQDPFTQVGTITVAGAGAGDGPAPPGGPGDDEPNVRRLTETQKQQKERTNRLGLDDYRTEGNAVATRCDAAIPEVDIANRDGLVTLRLLRDAAPQCKDVRPGDYAEADGVKLHEHLYDVYDLTVRKGR